MYEPHNPVWLTLFFLGFVAVFATVVIRCRKRKIAVPRGLLFGLWFLTAAQVFLMLGIRSCDDRNLRDELAGVKSAEVTKLVLRQGVLNMEVSDKSKASELLSLIQCLGNVEAHHSHPVDRFAVIFDYRGNRYQYQLGRDSERKDEYWVIPIGRSSPGTEGIGIGRVHSGRLGPLVEELLGEKHQNPRQP